MTMEITEISILPTNEGLVRAYVNIVFDNCFAVADIRVMQGPTELYVSFPAKKQRDGSDRLLACPANAQIHMMMQRVILAEYEKMVGTSEAVSNARTAAERLRVLEQLKSDGLISKTEYNTKRKEILGEL
jgi:DNA-binding cell septation regulator SpoVG